MSIPSDFRPIVANCTKTAGVVGVPGAFSFGADVPILIGIWSVGAGMIADEAGNASDSEQLKALASSTLSGVALFLGGSKIASTLFNLLPGPGTVAAIGVNSSLNAFFTYRFLRSVAKIYDKYDDEEMINRSLVSGLNLFSVWTIPADIGDMMEIILEADPETVEEIKKRSSGV